MENKVWISFQDENNEKVEGFFYLILEGEHFVKVKSNRNILTIPYHKINKIKQELKGGNKI